MLQTVCIGAAILMGVAAGANGLMMLASPAGWYVLVPGVTETGAYNQHFIRDIGLVFLFVSAAFLVGAAKPPYRVVLWGGASLWLGAHALFHVWEVAAGICAPSVLLRDFPAVTLPAVIGALLTLWAAREAQAGRAVHAPLGASLGRG